MTTQTKEFNMTQVFAMWIRKSKTGAKYLSGKDAAGQRLIGFFNGKKQNPKEPDVRIYQVDQEGKAEKEEYTSLWVNVSKNGKKYLTGKVGGKKVVGFINSQATTEGKRPYFSVYESEATPKPHEPKTAAPETDPNDFVPAGDPEELPF